MAADRVVSDGFLECFYVLDSKFVTKKLLDTFSAATWTERYHEAGDFSITLPVLESIVDDLKINDYVSIRESKEYMIIETLTLNSDVEMGDTIEIEGRSLSSILSRRIFWTAFKRAKDYNFQNGIKEMLEENVIKPKNEKRAIPGFTFKVSEDPAITELKATFDVEVGENLYDVIAAMCSEQKVGFRVLPKDEGGFEFELYMGVDRSWSQDDNPVVVFSDSYENLADSQYVQSEKEYISNALVKGETNQAEIYRKNERVGLARREAYFQVEGDRTPDDLLQRAKEQMASMSVTEMFGGTVEPYRQFLFGEDYFIGDIVQVQNKYGFEGRCRILEVLITRDDSGPALSPSFAVVDQNNEEVAT